MIQPTERSTVSISQPRIFNTFSVVDHARSSDTGKVWETDPASAVGASATSASSTNTLIFIREPPGPGVDSRFQHSASQPVDRRRPRRRPRPVAHDDDGGARARPPPQRAEADGAGSNRDDWKTQPTHRPRARLFAERGSALTHTFSYTISPASASSRSPRTQRSVLLPEPDCPTTATSSPPFTTRSTPRRTGIGSPPGARYDFTRPVARSTAPPYAPRRIASAGERRTTRTVAHAAAAAPSRTEKASAPVRRRVEK